MRLHSIHLQKRDERQGSCVKGEQKKSLLRGVDTKRLEKKKKCRHSCSASPIAECHMIEEIVRRGRGEEIVQVEVKRGGWGWEGDTVLTEDCATRVTHVVTIPSNVLHKRFKGS